MVSFAFNKAIGQKVVDFAAGKHFALAITNEGEIYGTGSRFKSQLDAPTHKDHSFKINVPSHLRPLKVFCNNAKLTAFILAEDTRPGG